MGNERIKQIETLVNKLESIIRELAAIKSREIDDLNSIKNSQGGEQQDEERLEAIQITIDQIYLSIFCIYESMEHLEDATGVAFFKAKYPRVVAYIKAKEYNFAHNFVKSKMGEKALERIINGEDYAAAVEDMEAEWKKYCEKYMWD